MASWEFPRLDSHRLADDSLAGHTKIELNGNLDSGHSEVLAFGHDKKTSPVAAFFPQLAKFALLSGVVITPPVYALVLDNEISPIVQLANEIGIEFVSGCLKPKGS